MTEPSQDAKTRAVKQLLEPFPTEILAITAGNNFNYIVLSIALSIAISLKKIAAK